MPTRGTHGDPVTDALEQLRDAGGPALEAHDVTFGYIPSQPVVRDLRFAATRSTVVGILGPNGSGKTTMLRLLAGTVTPSRGHITLDGVDLRSLNRIAVARRMAVVPQDTHPVFDYTVLEITLMGRYPHLGPFEVEGPADLAIARDALRATGTLPFEARPFSTLSGGEKQRVVIASALAQLGSLDRRRTNGTEVLLLDEPTASLDLAYQLEIASILTKLNGDYGFTIVVSTHDLNLAARVCHDLVLLRDGRVFASGPTAEVLTADVVRAVYGVAVDISVRGADGRLNIMPIGHDETWRPR
jgi:iron complex transport system ATP-binding protein